MATKISVLLISAFFALLQPLVALAQPAQPPAEPPYYYGPGHWHMWGGGWGFGWIFFLIFIFLIIFFIASLFRRHGPGCYGPHHWGPWRHMMHRPWEGGPWGDPTYTALQILNERFAKGEIQKQEYEEKKAAILSSGPR